MSSGSSAERNPYRMRFRELLERTPLGPRPLRHAYDPGMVEPSGRCPHCEGPAYQDARYPRALCASCSARAADLAGRAVALSNVSMSGGFVAHHRDDDSVCEQVTGDGRVLIDDVEHHAGEARMGGCVVTPVTR